MILRETPVLVLDCQATGASPQHGHLLEIGWLPMKAAQESTAVPSCTVVRLPDGAEIPPVVQRLTGLALEDLEDAPSPEEVWARLRNAASEVAGDGVAHVVIHFARFEKSFLEALHAEIEPDAAFPLRLLCTHEIARRLLPGIPRRGLRALAGYFGHGKGELRRAEGHVGATALVWRHLTDALAAEGITTLAELDAYLAKPAPKPGKRVYPMAREKRLRLPDEPGVYRLLRSSGDVLYVGKATSLKKRVNTYFQKQKGIPERQLELLSQVRDIDVTPTRTPLEAALLESDEIKRHDPPYNVALKAGARAPWFAVPGFEELAGLATGHARIGPLGSAWYGRRWLGLKIAVAADAFDEAAADAVRIAARAPGETEDDALRDGLAAFVAGLGDAPFDERAAMSIGARLWREQLAAGADPEIDEEEEAEEDEPWDADKVQEKLDEAVLTFAHVLRRAAWLRRLSESTVAFDDGALRFLRIERGQLVEAGDHDGAADLAIPQPRSYRARRRSFDLATFDRLRILTTELRRVTEAGSDAVVRLSTAPALDAARLRTILRWV